MIMSEIEFRESCLSDADGIEQLYTDAFPGEDLLSLVRELLRIEHDVISLVGVRDNIIAGHISFTLCHVEGMKDKVALLAPLAVTPALHGQGIGSALVQGGFRRLEIARIGLVLVLGDPVYYSRFGFAAEVNVTAPYPVAAEWQGAWQSTRLIEDAETSYEGKLIVPEPWRRVELWTP